MASLKTGYGLPASPADGMRARRMGSAGPPSNVPRTVRRTVPKEAESPGAQPQSRLPSRVPQPGSARRPSIPQPPARPRFDHQSQSWGSSTTAGSVSAAVGLKTHGQSGSGSSSSGRSYDSNLKPARNVLRRKSSSIVRDPTPLRTDSPRTSSSSSQPRSQGSGEHALGIQYDRGMTNSPAEIQIGHVVEAKRPQGNSPLIYPELDRYREYRRPDHLAGPLAEVPYKLATHDLPPATPGSLYFSANSSQVSAMSASPSAKWSESPGPGAFSRDTTPTSMSSQSPGLIAPRSISSRNRQHSPALTRPPVTRRRAGSFPKDMDATTPDPHGLAAVRESLTSSSSNSTVREGDGNLKRDKKPVRRLPAPPPSPPPRKSSQNFRPGESSPPKSSHGPRLTERPSPSLSGPGERPGTSRSQTTSPLSPSMPRRPSRDGTPDLHARPFGTVPVVHSNLSATSLPGERRGSESSVPNTVPAMSSPQISQNASTSHLPLGPDATVSPKKSRKDAKKLAIPEPSRPSRTPSPSVGPSHSRFNFFGRRKVNQDAPQDDKTKPTRKGPAAGTGHEGYGRIGGMKRRSGSGSGNLARGMHDLQSSQESLASGDSFFADRVNPVVIAGGGIIEDRNTSSELSRTESNQSVANDRPSTDSSKVGSETSLAVPRAGPVRGPGRADRYRRPSDSSDSEGISMKSTLAFRRSVQRLRSSPENPLRLPQPINTTGATTSPMTSFDTSVMSDDSYFEPALEVVRGRKGAAHPAPKKLTKRTRSPRKWNLFGRSQSQTPKDSGNKVAATVMAVEKKPVPFYAMMDGSEQEEGEVIDIQEVLRNAAIWDGTSDMDPRYMAAPRPGTPPAPIFGVGWEEIESSESVAPTPPAPVEQPQATKQVSGRPSRLPQVGRIPKVVSNRPELPSPRSFSRPFRSSLLLSAEVPLPLDPASVAKGPSPPESTAQYYDMAPQESSLGGGPLFASPGPSVPKLTPDSSRDPSEFFAFSPRKNSTGTTGTSSSSSYVNPFAGQTAVIPHPEDPPVEDEVWNEYDDMLGDKPLPSATSSKGGPFYLETYETKLKREDKPMESPTLASDMRKFSTLSKATQSSMSTDFSDMTERIRTAFQPHSSPNVPASIREDGAFDGPEPLLQSTTPRLGTTSSLRKHDSVSSCSSSEDDSPLAQVNLRVGSMTVSKWLTFGHVLFSDVRHELIPVEGSLKRHSILVIDGLGNDDWSFYAAETYPAASFFNLSPRAPLPEELQVSPASFPLSPPNHHQVQYMSHMEKLPFAPQSFTCVVYRFPVAASEAAYRNILSEARRVLKPGGYLELSILDVDMNNMGNRGRRAIRQLKERVHEQAPETSLASSADLMARLLGRVGFSGIKAARVGVPVASSIPQSDSDGAEGEVLADGRKKKKEQPSLAEMMRDESPVADEGITNMVARVGRWWYTRCYENAAGDSARSIWANKALLKECEELGTSLKLVVCCARAPDRVMSA